MKISPEQLSQLRHRSVIVEQQSHILACLKEELLSFCVKELGIDLNKHSISLDTGEVTTVGREEIVA